MVCLYWSLFAWGSSRSVLVFRRLLDQQPVPDMIRKRFLLTWSQMYPLGPPLRARRATRSACHPVAILHIVVRLIGSDQLGKLRFGLRRFCAGLTVDLIKRCHSMIGFTISQVTSSICKRLFSVTVPWPWAPHWFAIDCGKFAFVAGRLDHFLSLIACCCIVTV